MMPLEYQVAHPVAQLLGLSGSIHAHGNGDINPPAEHERCQHSSANGDRRIRDIVIESCMREYTQFLSFPGGGPLRSLVVTMIDKSQAAVLRSLPSRENPFQPQIHSSLLSSFRQGTSQDNIGQRSIRTRDIV